MNSVEFITSQLDKLVNSFPELSCRYEYDELSNTHLIEILPLNVYKSDEAYENREIEITDEFLNRFPDEGICFVSSDSIISVISPIFHRTGTLFGINENFDHNGWRTIENINRYKIDHFSIINRVDFICYPTISNDYFSIGMQHNIIKFNYNYCEQFLNFSKFKNSFTIYVDSEFESEDEFSYNDSNNLPLAA